MSLEPKKLALLRIYQILYNETDVDHPLKYDEIVEKLQNEYDLTVERKAIGRNISLLNEAGYNIVTTKKGSYLAERTFEDVELRILIDSILAAKHIGAKHSADLINKLCGLSNKNFKSHVRHVYRMNDWDKTDNRDLFYNMEVVDEAITERKKIHFQYNKYGADKTLSFSSEVTASPYQMILHNQRYYLMACNDRYREEMTYYRLDRITKIKKQEVALIPLCTIKGFENGIDYNRFSCQMPYMFADKPQLVTFRAEPWVIDQIIDWFGKNIEIKPENEKYVITVKTSSKAMEFWAMQYLNAVEILTPTSLREKIKENLLNATEKYNK